MKFYNLLTIVACTITANVFASDNSEQTNNLTISQSQNLVNGLSQQIKETVDVNKTETNQQNYNFLNNLEDFVLSDDSSDSLSSTEIYDAEEIEE